MLKFHSYDIYLSEIPDEISLGISVLGCDIHCKDCHSSYLWDINSIDTGTKLNWYFLDELIHYHHNISCILFFGGEWDMYHLSNLLFNIKFWYKNNLSTALYTGRDLNYINNLNKAYNFYDYLDYLKVGPYIKELGGLQNPNTNQKLYKLSKQITFIDKTSEFWK